MSIKIAPEEVVKKIPDLGLAQALFLLKTFPTDPTHQDSKALLLSAIQEKDMAPYYEHVCKELKWAVDETLLSQMKENNTAAVEKFNVAIKDATENLSQTEAREAYLAKAEYLCAIGAKSETEAAYRETFEKTVPSGQKIDIVFALIRLGLFYLDHDLIKRNIEKAESLIKDGGDWDRRNRLKVYRAYYSIATRDFKTATTLFLETISTFTSTELIEYKQFVLLAVLVSMLTLDRVKLKKSVVLGPEIQEVLHELPLVKTYLNSFYQAHYAEFFKSLARVEGLLKEDRVFAPHVRFYVREMRILAYSQLLESYRSVTMANMAASFGVTQGFIDAELSRFVAAGRIHCKIDKVRGIVETTRPDTKNAQYQDVIKQGDQLLNHIQKLSQVIHL